MKKEFTIEDVLQASYNLEPLKCLACNKTGECTFNQGVGDAYCANCGAWQLDIIENNK